MPTILHFRTSTLSTQCHRVTQGSQPQFFCEPAETEPARGGVGVAAQPSAATCGCALAQSAPLVLVAGHGMNSYRFLCTMQSARAHSCQFVGHKLFQTLRRSIVCRRQPAGPHGALRSFRLSVSLRHSAIWVALDSRYSCSLSFLPR